jgi:antitoxin component of MazEF toxin-antitoxin module
MEIDDRRVFRACRSLAIRIPREWAELANVHLGQTLYALGTMDGSIEISVKPKEWAEPIKYRMIDNGRPVLTIPAKLARTRGIKVGSRLTVSQSGSTLILRRES